MNRDDFQKAKAAFENAQAIKKEARAYVAKLADEGRSVDALQQNLSLLGIDFSKPLFKRQITFSGVRFD